MNEKVANNPFPRMHVSLYVSNLENSIEFYSKFFGTEPVKIKHKYAKYVLDSPSLVISFVENSEKVQSNFGHLGFQVETVEEVLEKMEQMKSSSLEIREEMAVSCCFAKQDKFWVNDPDGVQWEVYYFHQDVEFNDPFYESQEANACCTSDSSKSNDSKDEACCSSKQVTLNQISLNACCN